MWPFNDPRARDEAALPGLNTLAAMDGLDRHQIERLRVLERHDIEAANVSGLLFLRWLVATGRWTP